MQMHSYFITIIQLAIETKINATSIIIDTNNVLLLSSFYYFSTANQQQHLLLLYHIRSYYCRIITTVTIVTAIAVITISIRNT